MGCYNLGAAHSTTATQVYLAVKSRYSMFVTNESSNLHKVKTYSRSPSAMLSIYFISLSSSKGLSPYPELLQFLPHILEANRDAWGSAYHATPHNYGGE